MHAPSLGDIILAVRYLLAEPEQTRAGRCAALIARTREAQDHMRTAGMVHALYGDGSISSYVLRHSLASLPAQLDEEVFKTLTLVIEQIYPRQGHSG